MFGQKSTGGHEGVPRYTAWKSSAALLLLAQSADTATTLRANGRELNPMGSKTLAVGWVSTGAALTAEVLLRHHPRVLRVFTYMNFGLSAEHEYAAFHNSRL